MNPETFRKSLSILSLEQLQAMAKRRKVQVARANKWVLISRLVTHETSKTKDPNPLSEKNKGRAWAEGQSARVNRARAIQRAQAPDIHIGAPTLPVGLMEQLRLLTLKLTALGVTQLALVLDDKTQWKVTYKQEIVHTQPVTARVVPTSDVLTTPEEHRVEPAVTAQPIRVEAPVTTEGAPEARA
jgi:hypothetical protein